MSLIISENLKPLFQEIYGIETETVGKICDFCSASLPVDFVSTKCSKCPTIFDECLTCREWPRPDSTVCHKTHNVKSPLDNTTFSETELESIRKAINDSQVICRIFGQTWHQRHQLNYDHLDEDEKPHILTLDDSNEFRKRGLIQIAEMVDNGYQFILKGYTNCMIVEIKSPGVYKNICYKISYSQNLDEDDYFEYKGLVKISNLNIKDVVGSSNGWSLLKRTYSNESDALKAIHEVIDKIEKRYEVGGSEFEKARKMLY